LELLRKIILKFKLISRNIFSVLAAVLLSDDRLQSHIDRGYKIFGPGLFTSLLLYIEPKLVFCKKITLNKQHTSKIEIFPAFDRASMNNIQIPEMKSYSLHQMLA
jgi:hypothetical protein